LEGDKTERLVTLAPLQLAMRLHLVRLHLLIPRFQAKIRQPWIHPQHFHLLEETHLRQQELCLLRVPTVLYLQPMTVHLYQLAAIVLCHLRIVVPHFPQMMAHLYHQLVTVLLLLPTPQDLQAVILPHLLMAQPPSMIRLKLPVLESQVELLRLPMIRFPVIPVFPAVIQPFLEDLLPQLVPTLLK
jgi:hypothetical protein